MLTKFETMFLKGALKPTSTAMKCTKRLFCAVLVLGAFSYGYVFIRTHLPIALNRVLLILLVLMELYSISVYQSLIQKLHSSIPEEERERFS